MKKILFFILIGFSNIIQAQEFPVLKGDYLGQTPPGDTAVIFAPGIISLPDHSEFVITFTPDGNECYFNRNIGTYFKIYCTKRVNNTWTEQVEAPFSINQHQNVFLSYLSADGNRIFFETDGDIWKVDRITGGWSEPQRLPSPINSTLATDDHSYSETADSVVYFGSNRPGGLGKRYEIWRKSPSSDQAENLGPIVNSIIKNLTPCIAPDGSYLIYTQANSIWERLYISFNKKNNEWTVPVNMDKSGTVINIYAQQNRPTLSPDGKYLFYTSCDDVNIPDIYWVSTHIIVGLKKYAFAPRLNTQIPNMNIITDSVINYVIPASTFSCEYSVDSLKYTATSSNGAALPSWLSFNAETRTLSGTPKQAGTDTIKISVTNKDTVSASCTFKIKVSSKVGIGQLDENKIKISPNPTTGLINISFGANQFQQAIAEVFNTEGKLLLAKTFRDTVNETINLSYFPKGMYVLNLNIDGEIFNEKICLK